MAESELDPADTKCHWYNGEGLDCVETAAELITNQ
jgi:uncharacterized protein YodC (DUF2158 family)